MAPYNISFVGAGNVAGALCRAFTAAGQRIVSVSSKGGKNAQSLARESGAEWREDYTIPTASDLVIIAVSDASVAEVAGKLRIKDRTVIAHTAGSVALSALGRDSNAGVLYPLQSFSAGYSPDISRVPFFVEATDDASLDLLRDLVMRVGSTAYECDSERRRHLHLAAVFANNFSNFMMTIGETIAEKAGFDPALLKPLMEVTSRKALAAGSSASQTGPAIRNDIETIKSHIELLSFSPDYRELYSEISKLIKEYYSSKSK